MEELFVSSSFEETQEIASKLLSKIDEGTTICLYGGLAAGKTTFTQGLAKHLGINRVISPTFILMRQYEVVGHRTIKTLYHLDLYRLNSIEEIRNFDIQEIWSDESSLVVIEWPEKFAEILPKDRYEVFLKTTDDNEREIKIIHKR